MGYLSEGGGLSSVPRASTGSGSKDTSHTSNRANTTSSPQASAAAVKAASPTTSVSSHLAGSDTNATFGAGTQGNHGGNSQAFSGSTATGIAAAANLGGAQTGNRNSASTADSVNQDRPTWQMLQDQVDMLTPGMAHGATQSPAARDAALASLSVPGDPTHWADFVQNVQNGSLGVPRAAGYGKTYDPTAQISFDPMAQDTAAMEKSLAAPTGIDLAALAHSLNGPYLARQAANGGVPPFEGAVDWAGIAHALNGPYLRRVMQEAAPVANGALEEPVTREVKTTAVTAPPAAKANDWPAAWAALLNGSDRLPSEPVNPNAVAPAYTGDSSAIARTRNPDGTYSDPLAAIQVATANDVPLPRPRPATQVPAAVTVHGGAESDYGSPGLVTGTRGGPASAPSAWDKVVDNTGKLLSHTGLGALVSGMFPDLWNGMGDIFKGLDNGGGVQTKYPEDMATALADMYGDPHSGQNNGPVDFIDLNHNGIDDRLEGYLPPAAQTPTGTPGTSPPDLGGNQFRSNRQAVFPDMPPYRPGVDDEWNYFHDHLARGGVVGYADRDPRIGMIADAEDALHRGDHQHPSITQFVDTFGPKALEHLNNNVRAGYRMRAGLPARQVVGPGGPTDDAVPAVIDGVHPAKLSSGEVVMPVDAVQGAGDGDPKVGADRLMALSKRLAAK